MSHNVVQGAKHVADVTAIGAWVAHIAGWISFAVVPILTMIWLCLRIWESETVQKWKEQKRNKN